MRHITTCRYWDATTVLRPGVAATLNLRLPQAKAAAVVALAFENTNTIILG